MPSKPRMGNKLGFARFSSHSILCLKIQLFLQAMASVYESVHHRGLVVSNVQSHKMEAAESIRSRSGACRYAGGKPFPTMPSAPTLQ
jgi:hypothetical protein